MRRALLEVLVDPDDGTALTLLDDPGTDEIVEGILASDNGARYRIRGGVPRFVRDDGYSQSFGLQWNRFARVQLDSATGVRRSADRFQQEVSWSDDIAGRWVIDAGCGSGRFAEIAGGKGANVIAVDLSSACDAAHANLSTSPNIHVIQADLRRLPLRRDLIDSLYSIGVLQHTPNPLESACQLVATLPPGGRFAFTIYGRQPWTRFYSKYWWRPLTRRLPPGLLLAAIERAMPVAFPITSVAFDLPGVGRALRFLVPVANYPTGDVLPRSIRYDEAILDTFDMLSPRYDNPVTRAEVEAALAGSASDVTFTSDIPVVVSGRRV